MGKIYNIAQLKKNLRAENIWIGPVINFTFGKLEYRIKRVIFRRSQSGVKNKFYKSINIKYLLCVLCGYFLHNLHRQQEQAHEKIYPT